MKRAILCNHGFFEADCAPCFKRDGECDYGACEAAATEIVKGARESRRACQMHAATITVG